MTKPKLPSTANDIREDFPELWDTYTKFGKAIAESGPLDERSRRLVKLSIAIGAGSEGAVHSHARRAMQEGLAPEEIEHAALLAMTTLGFPRGAAALTWIRDVTKKP